MKIRPLYDRIVAERVEKDAEQTQGGLFIPDSAKEKPTEAVAVAVGKGKRLDAGTLAPLDVRAGDRIIIGKYAGSEIQLDGHDYVIVREDEVLGVLETKPPATRRAPTPADFEARYREGDLPWEIGRPQTVFQTLADSGVLRGRVLDAGCGTGEHTLMAAGLGLEATGIDMSPTAIAKAERKARERGLHARFLVFDALQLATLGEQFDTVLDSGLLHIFDDASRQSYVENLRAVVCPGGRYFMVGFSDRQPAGPGPKRLTEAEIRETFREGWRVDSIERKTMDTVLPEGAIQGWLVQLTRE